ncbi:MAG: efflux RND transporter periplasmic adaptor subunit [Bryobacteraceae bacterium]
MKNLSFVILAIALAGCSKEASPPEKAAATKAQDPTESNIVVMSPEVQKESRVETIVLSAKPLPEVVRSTARLTNDENRTWRVGSIAEGRIMTIYANVGDVVKSDQILARMHSHDIHESRAEFMKAMAELARRKGLVDYNTKVRDRAKRLYDLKAGSLEQLERTETDLRNAETDVKNAEVEVERSRSHITEVLGLELDAEGHAPSDEEDLIPVRAPAAGVILTRNVTPGTVVTPSTDQFLISDLGRLWAIAELNEEYLGKLRVGMPVRVFVQAYGTEPFNGRIGKIGDVLDPATRTVKVRVELTNVKGRLKPEMYATTEIELGSSAPVITVPAEAVQEIRGQSSVFVKVAPDRFEVRPVQTANSLAHHDVEISGSIKPGEEVVTNAAFIMKSEFMKASLTEGE